MAPVRVCPECHNEYDQASSRCPLDGALLLGPDPGDPPADAFDPSDGDTPAFGVPVVPDSLGTLGPYKLLAKLGEGTMAIVYAAEHSKLGRRCAIKRLRREHLVNQEIVQRFLAEARSIASIQHPNLVTIYDVVEEPDEIYLAMELLDGRDLKATLQTGSLSIERALRIAIEICDALVPVHARGIVHRDIKPANVFLSVSSGREQVKMLDFGAARLLGSGAALDAQMQARGTVLGSPAYMSPEQIGGEDLDARSDVYAIGVVLYEMLTGKPPFLGATPSDVMLQHIHEKPKTPTVGSAPAPREVERLVMRCLAKKRDDRYGSTAELARELRRIGALLGVDPIVLNAGASGSLPIVAVAPPPPSWPVPRMVAGGALLLVASSALAYRLFAAPGPPPRPIVVDAAVRPPDPPPAPATRNVRIESVPPGAFAKEQGKSAGCITPCSLELPLVETTISFDLASHEPFHSRMAPGERFVRAVLKPLAPPPPTVKPHAGGKHGPKGEGSPKEKGKKDPSPDDRSRIINPFNK